LFNISFDGSIHLNQFKLIFHPLRNNVCPWFDNVFLREIAEFSEHQGDQLWTRITEVSYALSALDSHGESMMI
jgi:hypothetical protein